MSTVPLPSPSHWGHQLPPATPAEIIEHLVEQTKQAIIDYSLLPDGPEPCKDRDGYFRALVEIPVTPLLFDRLMNGATGYRAHYSIGIEYGEEFNKRLIEAVAPLVVRADHLYRDKFDQGFAQRPKELTDQSTQHRLLRLKEELQVARWVSYWRGRRHPRKGLLAPVPESTCVLLNGTFVMPPVRCTSKSPVAPTTSSTQAGLEPRRLAAVVVKSNEKPRRRDCVKTSLA